jgi:hypothetical protein
VILMHTHLFLGLFVLMASAAACADDAGTGGSGGSGGGGGVPISCGESLTCEASEACIEDLNEPDCTDLANEADPCPDGTTKTNCGGIGTPCCCAPAPPPDYRCVSSSGCADVIDCACLAPCSGGDECSSLADGTFRCELPAMP